MDPIIKYILEQTSGVVIALVLIFRVESKLDSLVSAIDGMTNRFTNLIEKNEKNLEK